MRLASWNIDSIEVREDRVLGFLDALQPDVLCLQEIKVTKEAFPYEAIENAGYHAEVYGQEAENGVAILSRQPLSDVIRGMGPDDTDLQARLISGVIGDVRVFSVDVPHGESLGSDWYRYKLGWMGDLAAWIDQTFDPDDRIVLAGAFNVAPRNTDVERPQFWSTSVLCHEAARSALANIAEFGFSDVFTRHNTGGGVYTWWDHQGQAFQKDDGLRIDLILATGSLARRSKKVWVERKHRKKLAYASKPSEHAPVVAEFDLSRPTSKEG